MNRVGADERSKQRQDSGSIIPLVLLIIIESFAIGFLARDAMLSVQEGSMARASSIGKMVGSETVYGNLAVHTPIIRSTVTRAHMGIGLQFTQQAAISPW